MSDFPAAGGTGNSVSVRPLVADDVAALLGIVARSPEAAQWWPADYQQVARKELDGWVAELIAAAQERQDKQLAGFLVSRTVADEMEILNLAVESSCRRRGVASGLLAAALARGRECGARRVFLEVRASNDGAIAFYQAFGFAQAGRRSGYYSGPSEDGLVLSLQLVGNSV